MSNRKDELRACKICKLLVSKTINKTFLGCCSLKCHNEKIIRKIIERGDISWLQRLSGKRRSQGRFYDSREWKELRYEALRRHGFKCLSCGLAAKDGITLHVDHIKPRSVFPELELEIDNLQVLCATCNLGKSNIYYDDLRTIT